MPNIMPNFHGSRGGRVVVVIPISILPNSNDSISRINNEPVPVK